MSSGGASKKKAATSGKSEEDMDPIEDTGPDYSAQISRVLVALRSKSPITKNDLGVILQDSSEEIDQNKLWDLLKRSIYTRFEENTGNMYFEHVLTTVKSSNLKDFIDSRRAGVSREELVEFNPELATPIQELLRSANVLPYLGWRESNKICLMMYPRGTDFKVPLSGTVNAKPDTRFLETSHDLRREVRRGDAIIIDGKTYRVSAEASKINELTVRELKDLITNELGGDCGDIEERDVLEAKAHALLNDKGNVSKRFARKLVTESVDMLEKLNQYSSSSEKDPLESSKGPVTYKYEFDAKRLPLDRPYKGPPLTNVTVLKHGCTNDVREAYWRVAENPSNNFKVKESDRLDVKLQEKKLISEDLLEGINRSSREKSEMHARRLAEAASGKSVKKQRRSTVIKKITNVHMQ